jgi:hypothetical protein
MMEHQIESRKLQNITSIFKKRGIPIFTIKMRLNISISSKKKLKIRILLGGIRAQDL